MHSFLKRLVSMILVLVMIAALLPAGAVSVRAEEAPELPSADSSSLSEEAAGASEEESEENPEEVLVGDNQETPAETPDGDDQENPEQATEENPGVTPEENTQEQETENPENSNSSGEDEGQTPSAASVEEPDREKPTLAILGDSISTYKNASNGTAAQTTNSTIASGAIYYPVNGFQVTLETTWWYRAAQEMGMDILVNNSWSGSCLHKTRSGTVGAYVQTLLRLRHYYPDAQILAMLPTYTKSYYSDEKLAQANAVLAQICAHYDVPCIDLRQSGVTAAHLPDGIHPGAEGMDLITAAVIQALNTQCQVTPGDHSVYSVTHNLVSVKADKGYIRGVDAGSTFEEQLTGDNLEVTVTMGGVDITESCCADGRISIQNVTGALVITATGSFSLGSRLQTLPEPYLDVNLWPLLHHDADYYTGTGWGSHASGKVVSVTIPVQPGEKLYASSFAAGAENGSGGTNGIRVTFFSQEGVLVSMGAGAVYTEFTDNGYITVPEKAAAVNIPMWTDSPDWSLKVLGEGSGDQEPAHNPLLTGHLQQLPEPYYDVDLWQALEHDAMYYGASGWTRHNSAGVQSVTVPVTPGQRIYASSFGASSGNGSSLAGTAMNGIRVTWFTETGLLKSVSASDVYKEFRQNQYLTVPQEAAAVCIPVWNANDAQVKILAPGPGTGLWRSPALTQLYAAKVSSLTSSPCSGKMPMPGFWPEATLPV